MNLASRKLADHEQWGRGYAWMPIWKTDLEAGLALARSYNYVADTAAASQIYLQYFKDVHKINHIVPWL